MAEHTEIISLCQGTYYTHEHTHTQTHTEFNKTAAMLFNTHTLIVEDCYD